ncbi:MAG TPA: NAD-dependent deacylase [Candidatus Thalassarchaeaceae archaeon]|nr:NAD-dependent deacylase [Candidatus Thalassarchaeaceae archaeon]HJM67757.1 NAD-dependent deacylase [Candidatus Thalassarchaeaceae archaeon]
MKLLNPNTRVVVLTGAGISAESGIRTFRAAEGLWEEHRIEDVATPEGWRRDPELVWSFYQGRRRQLLDVLPNPAHDALVDLEEYLGENLLLVTQNVDDLHSRAGSNNLIHMHGELRKLRCELCEVVVEAMEGVHLQDDFVTCQECPTGRLRPHIVWFTEMPFDMEKINAAVFECDVFIAIGTSGHVYPAAGLLAIAQMRGAYCIGVNLDPPENVDFFDEFHQGRAGEILPDLVTQWVGNEEE